MHAENASAECSKIEKDFDGIQCYCMFIGHPRSGHSLFGSLLDAHPEMIVAHELNALRLVLRGFEKNQLFHRLLRRSRKFTRRGRKWHGYKYKVPNQWHGRYSQLKIIGHKKGGASTWLLGHHMGLLQEFQGIVKAPIKVLRVVRNPYDNIRTLSRYHHRNRLNRAIKAYFHTCFLIEKIKKDISREDWLDLYHEEIIANPEGKLLEACQFLGVSANPEYLKDCASIVFKEPRKRRYEIKWTPDQRQIVEDNIRKYGELSRYNYDS
jgi:hypothetical protein